MEAETAVWAVDQLPRELERDPATALRAPVNHLSSDVRYVQRGLGAQNMSSVAVAVERERLRKIGRHPKHLVEPRGRHKSMVKAN